MKSQTLLLEVKKLKFFLRRLIRLDKLLMSKDEENTLAEHRFFMYVLSVASGLEMWISVLCNFQPQTEF